MLLPPELVGFLCIFLIEICCAPAMLRANLCSCSPRMLSILSFRFRLLEKAKHWVKRLELNLTWLLCWNSIGMAEVKHWWLLGLTKLLNNDQTKQMTNHKVGYTHSGGMLQYSKGQLEQV